jgi:methylated-DNA-protein-cysteine methyltransferase-like protein
VSAPVAHIVVHFAGSWSSHFCVLFICLSVSFEAVDQRACKFLLCLPQHSPYYGTRFSEEGSRMSWSPVYKFVKQIPRGRVITYGALARALHLPGGARSAGRAMAATPSGKGIPWHRVVGARGKLLIREPYASLQRKLLESEGVKLLESRVDLKAYDWKSTKKGKPALIQKPKKNRTNRG